MSLIEVSRRLSARVAPMAFAPPVSHVYNPLDYARRSHEAYLHRYGSGHKRVLLIGMNPGPFGMAQTGVPFGDVASVRDFLGITAPVDIPRHQHPRRLIEGFDCPRSEVSGTRLWGWIRDRFGSADAFFRDCFVANYCPLVFMEASGRNRTPDKLPADERQSLFAACEDALRETVDVLDPEIVIGVGGFAERRAREALQASAIRIGSMLHPSPASPLANRNWPEQADKAFSAMGIEIRRTDKLRESDRRISQLD
jgi:single-strand selective monofunctional uracil DNA glycosylase